VAVIRINEIIDRLLEYHPQADTGLVQKSYVWSAKLHSGSLRKSGLPYLSHPLEVAGILTDLKLHESAIAAGLLHDVLEDSSITYEELEEEFGKEIAKLVDGVTKISRISTDSSRIEVQAENYRKMVLAMAQDVRVILIKLADRLHNMQTLEYLDEQRQQTIAQETMEIYAPIAGRLGIHWILAQLEDLSFQHLKPDVFIRLAAQTSKIRKARQEYMDTVQKELKKRLAEAGIEAEVTGRFKHLFSIYQKMQRQNLGFDEVYDVTAFRILVGTIPECYDALRVLHSCWTPVPGRIKDYIALPKPNMYRSLHTTIIGPENERAEIQIRTHEMHALAEYGIAAHWRYKEAGGARPQPAGKEKSLEFLQHLVEFHEELKDPYRFLESVKSEIVPSEIIVFTPDGDMIELPAGSTPIDFAYAIHSDIGNRCAGAKVNGRIVPLNHELKSGDTAEIITSQSVEPAKAWLDIVKTPRARARITHWISAKETERTRELGRQMLEAELLRHNLALGTLLEDGTMDKVTKRFSFSSTARLLEAVGFDKFPARKVVAHLVPPEELRPKKSRGKQTTRKKAVKKKTAKKAGAGKKKAAEKAAGRLGESSDEIRKPVIRIESYHDPTLVFCICNPVAGDEVVAVRKDDQTVEVHKVDCQKALDEHPERILSARWAKEVEGETLAAVEVLTDDRKGMLTSISSVISDANLNIERAVVHTTEEKKAIHTFQLSIKHLQQLRKLIKSLERINGVISVRRI